MIREICPTIIEKRFYVFARLDRLLRVLRLPGSKSTSLMTLEKLDHWLCGKIPSLNKLGGSVVLELYKPSTLKPDAEAQIQLAVGAGAPAESSAE